LGAYEPLRPSDVWIAQRCEALQDAQRYAGTVLAHLPDSRRAPDGNERSHFPGHKNRTRPARDALHRISKPMKVVNIVLIVVDQWRADCLSIAGHPVVHTPYLDQLALAGARFRQAYSAVPTCIPARAALFWVFKLRAGWLYWCSIGIIRSLAELPAGYQTGDRQDACCTDVRKWVSKRPAAMAFSISGAANIRITNGG
jgi:hypothetical protein